MAKTITSKEYYQRALFSPYIIWILCTILMFVTKILMDIQPGWMELLEVGGIFGMAFFSIIVWFIPYTIIAIAMYIWSMRTDIRKFIIVINFLPIILAAIIWISPMTLLDLKMTFSFESNKPFFSGWLYLAVISIVTGYVFVAISHGVHHLLKNKNIIVES